MINGKCWLELGCGWVVAGVGVDAGETTGANGLKITRLFHYKGATL